MPCGCRWLWVVAVIAAVGVAGAYLALGGAGGESKQGQGGRSTSRSAAADGGAATQAIPANARRVLFVGNSFTYTNDLPEVVQALAAETGQAPIHQASVVAGGASLEDHLVEGAAVRAIREGKWDIVVLQQGPSASEGRPSMYEFTPKFAEEIRRAGARPALFMVWPAQARFDQDIENCSLTYCTAAEKSDTLLFAGGEAFRAAWKLDPTLALYGNDGLHPTPAGTYLVALLIYEQIYGRIPEGMPRHLRLANGRELDIEPSQALVLQSAARTTNASFARK